MRFLGIDYGSKRVGLAISDEDEVLAFPYAVLENRVNLLAEIKNIIEKEGVGEVVIGESYDFRGEPNEIMKGIESFVLRLREETKLVVHFEPEFLTSQQAEIIQGKSEMLDASSAAIILQSFLDKRKNAVV